MKQKTTIVFESHILSKIDKMVEERKGNKNRSEITNELLAKALQDQSSGEIDKLYAPIVERILEGHMKSFENRIASLLAKNSLDSAMSMFLLLDSMARSRNIDPNKLYAETRSMAAKHVQKREELIKLLSDKEKSE